ncbi:DEAD/DEAH box helicase [Natronocalculus amylovorans]|uniref:DEAD/DEAH box helicase n=1 Tax=Natronocalculus amylovorans TaxID=2917812 RepID=A0AAE3G033_9EURY|nr:DEAD/DEAH box helicase [Natronocalculus amylovorans]MCL9817774.1 DEAD/DEAH box helicase [Natronocalculus amylovorans]
MDSPQSRLDAATNRAAEITWWNRAMTKLNTIDGVKGAQRFVADQTIERKGPFVEFVDAPAFHNQSAAEFLTGLDYDEAIIDAIVRELFGGDGEGKLYQHQAETINAIENEPGNNVLAVPTASGKTESFFLPILNACLSSDDPGVKAAILYPMKTLGSDQFNRFITYLDHINRNRSPEDRVTIGIWDSDTAPRVGTRDYEIEEGTYVRGLIDPRNPDEKLRVNDDASVGTDDNTYSWIKVTRDSIRQGVDILLTNPEALDYMFVSDNEETRAILDDQPLEHIVFDEAHVWSGIQGAAISLLSQRLKTFYANNDPQVTMVSATVDNPTELAASLTGSSMQSINSIEFTGRQFSVTSTPNFDRFAPCGLDEIIVALAVAGLDITNPDKFVIEQGLENAVTTLREIGLLDTELIAPASDAPSWAFEPIQTAANRWIAAGKANTVDELLRSEDGCEELIEAAVESGGFSSGWYEFVLTQLPEVASFTEWFDRDTTGEVGFRSYDGLVSEAERKDVANPERILETVMAFGRLAGIVTEKYHVFLKPPHSVHWCGECGALSRDNRCRECGHAPIPEIQFCRNGTCHEPHVAVTDDEGDEHFVPIRGDANGDCPGCGKSPRLTDIGVPTSSLLSYMLSEVCRVSPSKKTLVFSDSHSAAESVGEKIIDTEYGLMAQTLYLNELLAAGGEADQYELFRTVAHTLRKEYWEPLVQNNLSEDAEAYNFLIPLREDIEAHAYLSNCESLLDSALVTADVVAAYDDPVDVTIAHALYKRFVLGDASFQYSGVKIDGLTRAKILDRLSGDLIIDRSRIEASLDTILADFLESGIISIATHESLKRAVDDANLTDKDKRTAVGTFLEETRDELEQSGIVEPPADSGVFSRNVRDDDSALTLVQEAVFCMDCYTSFPTTESGNSIDSCHECGAPVEAYTRFTEQDNGELICDPGYAVVDSGWEYAVDHWAHDVTEPIRNGAEPDFVTAGIHKGNISPAIRGAIEEGFRKDPPEVNVVSSTPTMELGVDIGSLDTVAQVGVPPTLTNYVQRSGRTGRTRGSSSLVMTVIRGQHPVDGHYYANLDSYLGEFEPVRIPDPHDFDEVLASHIVTEVFAYLARNPHESGVFERMYKVPEPELENLEKFVSTVEERLDIFGEFIREEMDPVLREYVKDIFGDHGVDVYEQVFFGDGPLSLSRRVEQTFSRLRGMSTGATANRNLTSNTARLDQWLSKLGYLANYRSFGQNFPVNFSGRREEISFEGSGRLYDMYPGEENNLGGMVSLHGTDYIVKDVRGTPTPLTDVAVCDNDECDRRFKSFDPDEEICPHCDSELAETQIHGISSVECSTAMGGQKGYRTHAQMSTYVRPTDAERDRSERQLFDIDCKIEYGQFEITDFVYAFERGHSMSASTNILRSQALIEQDDGGNSTTGLSWRDRLDEAEQELYRPVGQQHHTQGLRLSFDRDTIFERFEQATHETVSWPQLLTSLEQALDRAIPVVVKCDRSDYRVKASITNETIEVYIVDGRQGGNGIGWHVHDSLSEVADQVVDVADCDRCVDYCDECLLLSRTPSHYLENNLLDHRMLATVVGHPGQ